MPDWIKTAWRSLSPTGRTVLAVVVVLVTGVLIYTGKIAL